MKQENWYNHLSDAEKHVIENGGTEPPFSGALLKNTDEGTYTCRRCGAPLYRSGDKFDSGCGWPSFDDEVSGAVKHLTDQDGRRTEIRCARCDGHLGHVFVGEGFTDKSTRHCVNSLSISFANQPMEETYFAGGCFWGVEHLLGALDGVKEATSGYMGGHIQSPTYRQVCSGRSGHAEVVRVQFDPTKIGYLALAKRFFEIHDPTEVDRQGPDIGDQYRSEVFVLNQTQQDLTELLISSLKQKGFSVATKVTKADIFWPADPSHQKYYTRTGSLPYCHSPVDRFGDEFA